jgi:hypothetical protein
MVQSGQIFTAAEFNQRGWVNGAGITTSSGSITTETVVITIPSTTYKAGRAYELKVSGNVTPSVSGTSPLLRFRKTNAGGQQFDTFRVACNAASSHGAGYSCYFTVGASDVTAAIVLTLTAGASGTVVMAAAATSPSSLNAYDVGEAGDFPWAAVLA